MLWSFLAPTHAPKLSIFALRTPSLWTLAKTGVSSHRFTDVLFRASSYPENMDSRFSARGAMYILLKLLLAPLITVGVTLATRRWGNAVGGWLAGFPVLAGPISFLLALDLGLPFAQEAAHGTILGLVGVCAFILAYAEVSKRRTWRISLAAGLTAFLATLSILHFALPSFAISVVLLAGALAACIARIPMIHCRPMPRRASPWDLPLRAAVVTALVLTITALAPLLGGGLSGLISPIPVFTIVFVVVAHRTRTARAVQRLLRGASASLVGAGAFFAVIHLSSSTAAINSVYACALLIAALVNAATYRFLVAIRVQS